MRGERDQVPRATTAELRRDAVGAAQFSAWRCQPLALTASCSRQGRFAVAQAVQKGDSAPETLGIWRMSAKVTDQHVSESAASVRRERFDGSRVKKEAAAAASDRFDEVGITLGRFSRQPRSRGSGRANHCRYRQHGSPRRHRARRRNPRHRRTRPGRTGGWSGG